MNELFVFSNFLLSIKSHISLLFLLHYYIIPVISMNFVLYMAVHDESEKKNVVSGDKNDYFHAMQHF